MEANNILSAFSFVLLTRMVHSEQFTCDRLETFRIQAAFKYDAEIYMFGEREREATVWLTKIRWNDRRKRYVVQPNYPKNAEQWTREDIIFRDELTLCTPEEGADCPDGFRPRLVFYFGNLAMTGNDTGFVHIFNATDDSKFQYADTSYLGSNFFGGHDEVTGVRSIFSMKVNDSTTFYVSIFRSYDKMAMAQLTATKNVPVDKYPTTITVIDWNPNDDVTRDGFLRPSLDVTEETQTVRIRSDEFFGYEFRSNLSFPVQYTIDGQKLYRVTSANNTVSELTVSEDFYKRVPESHLGYVIPVEAWFGCPLDRFCLGTYIDGVLPAENNAHFVFIGHFVYLTQDLFSPLEKRYYIEDVFLAQTGQPSTPHHLDAAFTDDNGTFYLVKDRRAYIYQTQYENYRLKWYPLLWEVIPTAQDMQTALTLRRQDNHAYLYVFHDENFAGYVSENKFRAWNKIQLISYTQTTDLNTLNPQHIDTAFIYNQKVYIVDKHFVASMAAEKLYKQTVTEPFVLLPETNLFGCANSSFKQLQELNKELVRSYAEKATPKPFSSQEFTLNLTVHTSSTTDQTFTRTTTTPLYMSTTPTLTTTTTTTTKITTKRVTGADGAEKQAQIRSQSNSEPDLVMIAFIGAVFGLSCIAGAVVILVIGYLRKCSKTPEKNF